MQGHTQANCHLRGRLRQDGQSEDGKKSDPLKGFKPPKSCCFCGRRGHVFEECRSRQGHRGNSRRERQKATLARLASSMTPVTKRSDLGGRLYRQNRMARSLDAGGGFAGRFALDSDDDDGDADPRTRKRIERATNRVERKLFEKALKRTLGQKSKAKKKGRHISSSPPPPPTHSLDGRL
ncbi:unnamed protein product [Dibothriocephalus latus]|uniref:CCHC-type domain-containing protein n=1 Tax=Dibothriocephalus latus TaxID=60516 RepID=A0A3P7NTI4_DIBLA|nr:unnamed protein product [Dibothriocephalus latus]